MSHYNGGCNMVSSPIGFSVNVFIPSGRPSGLWIIEKTNWSGVGLKFPRDGFNPGAKDREEMARPGVYILWGQGESDDPNRPQVYIGEADSLADRLSTHIGTDDQPFWQQTIVFTSKDVNLNKAHVLFIEAQLVRIAKHTNRCDLSNKQTPNEPNLADRETSYALEFLEALRLCLPIAGIHFFEELPYSPTNQQTKSLETPATLEDRQATMLNLAGAQSGATQNVSATGYINGAEFVVLAGAAAAKEEAPSIPRSIRASRERLIHSGQFKDEEHCYRLVNDYSFNSPSAAAGVLLGRSANGRDEWKNSDQKSINDMAKIFADG